MRLVNAVDQKLARGSMIPKVEWGQFVGLGADAPCKRAYACYAASDMNGNGAIRNRFESATGNGRGAAFGTVKTGMMESLRLWVYLSSTNMVAQGWPKVGGT